MSTALPLEPVGSDRVPPVLPPEGGAALDPACLPAGTRLGKFEILRPIADGGMSAVYVARDRLTNAEVALKVLVPEGRDPRRSDRFKRETLICQRIQHDNLIRVHDLSLDRGYYFLSMELLHGRDLAAELEEHPVPPLARVAEIVLPVLNALETAHQAGVVHRDLKPNNVFLTEAGCVKVLDFGCARDPQLSSHATDSGLIGTPNYMAPEQAQGSKDVDGRADLYSVGVMLYEMLTGRRPFHADGPVGIMVSVLRDTPPPVTAVNPSVPIELGHVVGRCLEKDPRARYQSVADLRRALVAALALAVPELTPIETGGGVDGAFDGSTASPDAVPTKRLPRPAVQAQSILAAAPAGLAAAVPESGVPAPVALPLTSAPADPVREAAAPPVTGPAPRKRTIAVASVVTLGLGASAAFAVLSVSDRAAYAHGYECLRSLDLTCAAEQFRRLGPSPLPLSRARGHEGTAAVHVANREYADAASATDQALSIEPELVYAHVIGGDLAAADGDLRAAAARYVEAVQAAIGEPWQRAVALCRSAELALRDGNVAAAREHLEAASSLADSLAEVRRTRATLAMAESDPAAAIDELSKLLAAVPTDSVSASLLEALRSAETQKRDEAAAARTAALIPAIEKLIADRRSGRPAEAPGDSPEAPPETPANGPRTFWLLPVEETGGLSPHPGLRGALDGALADAVREIPDAKLVERGLLDELLSEQRLAASDLADPSFRLRLGRIIGARYLLIPKLHHYRGESLLRLEAVDVETTEILAGPSQTIDLLGDPHSAALALVSRADPSLRLTPP